MSVTPNYPTIDDSITIEFDAALGNAALVGVPVVYAHTGVINKFSTDLGDWEHQKSPWDSGDDSTIRMTSLGGNRHRIGFRPRTFYGIGANEEVRALAFVFRNEAGTLAGKNADGTDIVVPIYPSSGFSAIFAAPMERPEVVALGAQLQVNVQANAPGLITVFQDGIPIGQSAGLVQQFAMTIPGNMVGRYDLSFTADNGTTVVRDTLSYVVQPPVNVVNQPTGSRDGINYMNDSTVVLVLLAPYKDYVYVIGDFNDWQMDPAYLMNRTPDGLRYWFELGGLTPAQEYRFQYFVDHQIKIGDPYTEKVLDPFNDNGVNNLVYPNLIDYPDGKTTELVSILQTAKPEYNWQVNNFQRPDNRDLVIYELLVRDFSIRHDYTTIIDSLSYLKTLGINAIELMPTNEFDGNQSWGYGPAFYFAPDKYYGTENKLKEFIDSCHARGIAVIMDGVFNHMFGQSPFLRLYQDRGTGKPAGNNLWFNVDAPHPLGVGYDLNHSSGFTRALVDSAMSYWAQEYRIDGWRLDLSKGFTNTFSGQDIGVWSQYDQSRVDNLQRLATHFWTHNFGKYIILEHLGGNDEETVLANYGMMLWGKASEPYYQSAMGYEQNSDFSWFISHQHRGWTYHNLVGFIESHDEQRAMYQNIMYGNSSTPAHDCSDTTVALKRMAQIAAFWATVPGPKMMWQFQELGYDYPIEFGCRTCPKPIRWNYLQDSRRQLLYKKFAAIINLKTKYPEAFRSGSYDISAWGKQKQIHVNSTAMNVTVAGNFDVVSQNTFTGFQHTGRWYNYMAGDSLEVTDVNMTIALLPGDFRIYTDVRLPKPDLSVTVLPVGVTEDEAPSDMDLTAFPNPFSGSTTLAFRLPKPANVTMEVYDLVGVLVYKMELPKSAAGEQQLTWDGRNALGMRVSAGTYLCKLTADGMQGFKKLVLAD
ncbi:MAG: T9SS type A sorting domain-containing protein [Bacteroidetes bacterium]|nr:T9SS type A sorting domain-containing protein [Bacteroidota bacterium]